MFNTPSKVVGPSNPCNRTEGRKPTNSPLLYTNPDYDSEFCLGVDKTLCQLKNRVALYEHKLQNSKDEIERLQHGIDNLTLHITDTENLKTYEDGGALKVSACWKSVQVAHRNIARAETRQTECEEKVHQTKFDLEYFSIKYFNTKLTTRVY